MPATRALTALAVLVLLLTACDGDDEGATTATSTTTTDVEESTTTVAVDDPTTTSEVAGQEHPAVWPAAEVALDTPEEAAEGFVEEVLGVPPTLGEFRQGDARSGEIEVFSPGEGEGGSRVLRSVLLLRRLGPEDGWFVVGAVSEHATITTPESAAEVPAGSIDVAGSARGFEASVVVSAYVAGDAEALLDRVTTQGGAFEEPEPYSVTLDLSGASPGDVVILLVRGATGLETDPGDFGAVPVVVTS